MPNENDESELVEAIEGLMHEVSNLNDSARSLHKALEIIHDQTLKFIQKS